MLSLSCNLLHTCTQTLKLAGDWVKSCLTSSASFYNSLSETQQDAICEKVVPGRWRKVAEGYTDRLDFLLCEIYVNFQRACRAYYAGKGDRLKLMYTRRELRVIDQRLCFVLRQLNRGKLW